MCARFFFICWSCFHWEWCLCGWEAWCFLGSGLWAHSSHDFWQVPLLHLPLPWSLGSRWETGLWLKSKLSNVLYVPAFWCNLLSVSSFKQTHKVSFQHDEVLFTLFGSCCVARAVFCDGLYYLLQSVLTKTVASLADARLLITCSCNGIDFWIILGFVLCRNWPSFGRF